MKTQCTYIKLTVDFELSCFIYEKLTDEVTQEHDT